MSTVIIDKSDINSVMEALAKFKEDEKVDVYSSKISPVELAIVVDNLKISEVIVQPKNNTILFVLNNGTVLQRNLSELTGLQQAKEEELYNFENMGDGVIWPAIPAADVSLKNLIKEEVALKYKVKLA